ncbi:extracellular calcium-sensing receptor-like [Ornithorhynchus anatinus]|uniref:extracellular calcium-sensing receptor-like n=1 Tax=Ornithorhynchus anatinus TaxID=9258 RepID=UPI0010A7C58C|nr:extracellular calcium-sensing receptor-like [Ornithorhynchus anatinus]
MGILTGQGQALPNVGCRAGPPAVAVVGEVSYASTVASLGDRTQFPSFLRTTPSDLSLLSALVRLVLHWGWSWVGILAQDDEYGQQGGCLLRAELEKAGTCTEFLLDIPTSQAPEKVRLTVAALGASTARAVVTLQETLSLVGSRVEIPGFPEFLRRLPPARAPGGDELTEPSWKRTFRCQRAGPGNGSGLRGGELCTGTESPPDWYGPLLTSGDLRETYNAYTAVYSTAHALHGLRSCEPGGGPFGDGACADIRNFQPWQLLHYLRKVRFRTFEGAEIFFDANGNLPASYDILRWQETPGGSYHFLKVGSFDSPAPPEPERLLVNESAIVWQGGRSRAPRSVCSESCPPGSRKITRQGQKPCCFDCTPCPEGQMADRIDEEWWPSTGRDRCVRKTLEYLSYLEPLGATLAAAAVSSALLCAAVLGLFIRHRHTPIVRANNRELSYLLLTSLALCNLSCLLQVLFGLAFTLAVSCVLAKTVLALVAFRATRPASPLQRWLGPGLPRAIVAACMLTQGTICAVWMAVAPPFSARDMTSWPGKIILECHRGSAAAFWGVLGYLWLLAVACLCVAFLSRRLPGSFGEARFITFSMAVFVDVWLAFLPAYLSTRGQVAAAVEVLSILASSAGLLGCIFLPKCYVLLLRPDRNTRECLMGRGLPGAPARPAPAQLAVTVCLEAPREPR